MNDLERRLSLYNISKISDMQREALREFMGAFGAFCHDPNVDQLFSEKEIETLMTVENLLVQKYVQVGKTHYQAETYLSTMHLAEEVH